MRADAVWTNARLATCAEGAKGLGVVEEGLVASLDGRIVYAGPRSDAPAFEGAVEIDCEGRWITPGLVDCHTHLVYAGNRAGEFERRLAGDSYEAIAKAGGGILSTVSAVRAASLDELVAQSLPRLDALIAEGVTSIEIKSGYGLSLDHERKLLRAARRLGELRPVSVSTTFLGAHALPPEAAGDRDGYVDLVCREMLPALAAEGLVDAVDAFCEHVAFSAEQTARVFTAARELGIPVKLHADQLSDSGGADLCARFDALSADHLEYASEAGISAMAQVGVVAVLLPGAFYFLRETRRPPVDRLRARGAVMALATDCNPGTSPLTSLLLTMNMGATLFGLTVEECLLGVTRHAATALGRGGEVGVLRAGGWCDLAVWSIEQPVDLVYRIGFNPLHARVWRGRTT